MRILKFPALFSPTLENRPTLGDPKPTSMFPTPRENTHTVYHFYGHSDGHHDIRAEWEYECSIGTLRHRPMRANRWISCTRATLELGFRLKIGFVAMESGRTSTESSPSLERSGNVFQNATHYVDSSEYKNPVKPPSPRLGEDPSHIRQMNRCVSLPARR